MRKIWVTALLSAVLIPFLIALYFSLSSGGFDQSTCESRIRAGSTLDDACAKFYAESVRADR